MTDELRAQIDAAFDYRGHVTVKLSDGGTVVGYLFNRHLDATPPAVSLMKEGSGDEVDVPLSRIASIELSGKDHAEPWTPPNEDG